MVRTALVAIALLAGTGAVAETSSAEDECAALGLESQFLTRTYCKLLKELADENGATRSFGEGSTDTDAGEAPGIGDLEGITIIRDAYRADPKKTLDLIKRIKNAGGLGETNN